MKNARVAPSFASGATAALMTATGAIMLFSLALWAAAPSSGKEYPTPLAAADALLTAGAKPDLAALEAVLGPGAGDILFSGDKTADANDRAAFLLGAKEKTVLLSLSETTVFLMVGYDNWPFPIP